MSFLLGLLLVLLQIQPVYSVVFGTDRREVRVATLYMDGTWQVTTLPEGMVLGQRDATLVLPQWVDSSLYLVAHQDPPLTNDSDIPEFATAIHRFDVETQSTTHIMDVLAYSEESPRFLKIVSVSPDGRYLWTQEYMTFTSYLVDLQAEQIVTEFPCLSSAVAWDEDSVTAINTNSGYDDLCLPQIMQINLSDGSHLQALTIEYVEPVLEWDNYPGIAFPLADGRFIVQTNGALGVVDLHAGTQTYFEGRFTWALSPDESKLAYIISNEVYQLDLATLESEEVSSALSVTGPRLAWSGETLIFWRGSSSEVIRVEITGDNRVETPFYSGDAYSQLIIAPDQPAIVLSFEDGSLAVYNADGQVGETFTDVELQWGQLWANEWFHFTEQGVATALNTATGESIDAPEPGYWFVTALPDGEWWLYSRTPRSGPGLAYAANEDSLIAFNPTSGEVVVLAENVALAERNFHFEPAKYYVWSDYFSDSR